VALLALTPVLVAAGRIVLFSRGDPALLSALGRSLDVPGVLLGGVVPFLGTAVSLALYVIITNRHVSPQAVRWLRDLPSVPLTLLMVLVSVAVLTTPVKDSLALVALPVFGLAYRWIEGWVARRRGHYVAADVAAIVAVLVLLVFQSSGPWMVAEVVTLSDDSQTTAYVVGTEEGWTTLVGVDDRHVSRVPADDIDERQVCGSERGRTLLQWMSSAEAQAPCPSGD
jgi:hypothetical protein